MRKKTLQEEVAIGLLSPIFRDLAIKKSTRGYEPLLDFICIAYAYPTKNFQEIMEILKTNKSYVGVKNDDSVFSLFPSMERTIETALEGTPKEILSYYELDKLSILIEDKTEQLQIEEQLLEELGEKYNKYKTHEERVIVFFTKKLLKHLP